MAGFPVGLSNSKVLNPTWVLVSMITIITVILASVLLRGFLKVIPILIGIVTGYLVSCFFRTSRFYTSKRGKPLCIATNTYS